MTIPAIDRLRFFLRPPGRGLYTHSTGGGYAQQLLRKLYRTEDDAEAQRLWEDSLQKVRRAEALLFAIPSDSGASIMRGANFGPIGVREAYLTKYKEFPKRVVDIGDVIVIPQLLHDDMLNDRQKAASQVALYGKELGLPVSPLSIAEAVYDCIIELNPRARVFMIGGDHSVSWPPMVYCHKKYGKEFGVLHFDAHTDLLDTRLGVKICFATWAYHALKLMEPYHLAQIGVRTSARKKEEWMKLHPILQVWANEVPGNEEAVIKQVVAYFEKSNIKHLYITNDIDGTDASLAPATGTPEPNGLSPQFVKALIGEAKKKFELIGGDVVEVAPPLSGERDYANERTCLLAAEYLDTLLQI